MSARPEYVKYVCETCGSSDVSWDAWADYDPLVGHFFLRERSN